MGGSSDSDFGLGRSHRPDIDLIIISNDVSQEQQLLIIVVNVMLHAQLYFLLILFRKWKQQACIIFKCISGGGLIKFFSCSLDGNLVKLQVGLNSVLCCRVQEKPLLESQTSPDDDGWAGWGDSWGKKNEGTTQDQWGSWSNESPSPPEEKANDKKPADEDGWSADNWGGTFTPSPSAKKASKTSGKSRKKNEPDTANLIDLDRKDDAGSGDTTGLGDTEGKNDGWDNEVWAQDDDDDVWKTLELDSSGKDKQSGTSKKGD